MRGRRAGRGDGPTHAPPPARASKARTPIEGLRGALAEFDAVDVMTAVAGLSLHPPNSGRILRLEACAEIASTVRLPAKKTRLTPIRLRSLISRVSTDLIEVVRNEDPFDGPMVEGAAIFGRDVRLLPGLAPEDVFSFRKLAHALEVPDLPTELDAVRDLMLGVAAISTSVVSRAELPPACAPELTEDHNVVFPAPDAFARLRRAVRFRADDLAGICQSAGVALSAVSPLVQELGSRAAPEFAAEDGALTSRPIVKAGDWYVLAAPHCLLRAVFLHLLRDRADVHGELGTRFHAACRDWLSAFAPMITDLAPSKLAPITGGDGWLFTGWGVDIDIDKVLFIALVTEARGELPDLGRLHDVLAVNLAGIPSDQHVLLLVLYQRLLNPVALPRALFSNLGSRRLACSLHDLETMLLAEPVGPLGLWYYAGSLDRFESGAAMAPGSNPLDLWAFYRDHKHSFYLGDDKSPKFVWLTPCYASDFRCWVAQNRRRHGVLHHSDSRCVEVVSATAESRTLSFIAVDEADRHLVRVVEAGVPVWIRGVDGMHADDPIADAVAFWVGELTPFLSDRLLAQRVEHPRVVIDVACSAPTAEECLQAAGEPPRVAVERIAGRLVVEVRSMTPFATKANEGERDLVGRLHAGLLELCGERLDDGEVARVVDEVAPLGPKKNLHISVDTHDPELDTTALPRPNPVRDEVAEDILDGLGEHLGGLGRFVVGVRSPELLNEAVSYLFGRLRDGVSSLSPHGLLEMLVAQHEAIIRETAWRERTLPAQRAVARDDAAFIQHVTDAMPRLAETAVAGRFLIEYVAATPPAGSARLSRTGFDELLSMASMVVSYGSLSDVAHHGLVELGPALLPSGRLGVDRQRMRAIYEVVHRRRAITGASRLDALPTPRETAGAAAPPAWKERIDPALRDEFGYSLAEFGEVASVLTELAFEGRRAVARRRQHEVVEAVVNALGWERPSVERVLGGMTLGPRDAFERSAPLERFHVYPWRFNRELSYLRRPLVLREGEGEGGAWLLWGPRNLYRAWRYLLLLITEGRLRAQPGGELARVISEIAQELHERFNDEVADWFDALGFGTRRRAGKFGSIRIADDDGDLGDVDVLVVDEARRRLLAVECKDLHLALAATDIANQLAELHRKLSNHRRRADWLVREAARVQAELGLSPGEWEILCVVVTEEPLVSQAYRDLPVPVLAFAELESDPELAWPTALLVGRVFLTSGG